MSSRFDLKRPVARESLLLYKIRLIMYRVGRVLGYQKGCLEVTWRVGHI